MENNDLNTFDLVVIYLSNSDYYKLLDLVIDCDKKGLLVIMEM